MSSVQILMKRYKGDIGAKRKIHYKIWPRAVTRQHNVSRLVQVNLHTGYILKIGPQIQYYL